MRLVQVVGLSLVLFGASAEAQDMQSATQSAAQNGSQFPRAQIDQTLRHHTAQHVPRQAVAQLTNTVPERLTSVNASLKPVRDFCETV